MTVPSSLGLAGTMILQSVAFVKALSVLLTRTYDQYGSVRRKEGLDRSHPAPLPAN